MSKFSNTPCQKNNGLSLIMSPVSGYPLISRVFIFVKQYKQEKGY